MSAPDDGAMNWHKITAVPPTEGGIADIAVQSQCVVLCNVGGTMYAVENRCPHANAPLAGGRLNGHILECPLHGGKIDVRDGSALAAPIRRSARTFALRNDAGLGLEIGIPEK